MLHERKYTEYSRVILALTAIGRDPSKVAGYNLLMPLGDFEKTIWQGLNGPIWALIALDSGNYEIPKNPAAKTQATRQLYIDEILNSQMKGGGWSLTGTGDSDVDISAMALQALAKYQDQKAVKTATDKALTYLSKVQDSKGGYDGKDGYKKADGTVIGTSTYDVFGKTFYDISYDSMTKLGFPLNADAHLITNDNKLNGSNKQPIRDAVANGAKAYPTGERTNESTKHPGTFDIDEHYIAMFCGDDLNDISTIFSGDAVDRVQKAIDNMDKWGTEWIILPNAIYGSSINAAGAYGYLKLLETFDYTNSATAAWNLYK